jgi:hypothetical protein
MQLRGPSGLFPVQKKKGDEGMTNEPPIFAYLVFGPGGMSREKLSRPIKAVAWCDSAGLLGVQARLRGVQDRLELY